MAVAAADYLLAMAASAMPDHENKQSVCGLAARCHRGQADTASKSVQRKMGFDFEWLAIFTGKCSA